MFFLSLSPSLRKLIRDLTLCSLPLDLFGFSVPFPAWIGCLSLLLLRYLSVQSCLEWERKENSGVYCCEASLSFCRGKGRYCRVQLLKGAWLSLPRGDHKYEIYTYVYWRAREAQRGRVLIKIVVSGDGREKRGKGERRERLQEQLLPIASEVPKLQSQTFFFFSLFLR